MKTDKIIWYTDANSINKRFVTMVCLDDVWKETIVNAYHHDPQAAVDRANRLADCTLQISVRVVDTVTDKVIYERIKKWIAEPCTCDCHTEGVHYSLFPHCCECPEQED